MAKIFSWKNYLGKLELRGDARALAFLSRRFREILCGARGMTYMATDPHIYPALDPAWSVRRSENMMNFGENANFHDMTVSQKVPFYLGETPIIAEVKINKHKKYNVLVVYLSKVTGIFFSCFG